MAPVSAHGIRHGFLLALAGLDLQPQACRIAVFSTCELRQKGFSASLDSHSPALEDLVREYFLALAYFCSSHGTLWLEDGDLPPLQPLQRTWLAALGSLVFRISGKHLRKCLEAEISPLPWRWGRTRPPRMKLNLGRHLR